MAASNSRALVRASRSPLLPSANRNTLMYHNKVSDVARVQLRLTTRVRFAHFVSRVCLRRRHCLCASADGFGFNY